MEVPYPFSARRFLRLTTFRRPKTTARGAVPYRVRVSLCGAAFTKAVSHSRYARAPLPRCTVAPLVRTCATAALHCRTLGADVRT